jgi:hypothetical protein
MPEAWEWVWRDSEPAWEEDDMSETTPALDEAFERMAAASFELPNGFVNHGAMACEALAMLDCADEIDGWARRFAQQAGRRLNQWHQPTSSGSKHSASTIASRSGSASSPGPWTRTGGLPWSGRGSG